MFFKEEVGGEVLRLLALSDQNKDIQFIISNQGNYLNDKLAIKLVLNGFQRSQKHQNTPSPTTSTMSRGDCVYVCVNA